MAERGIIIVNTGSPAAPTADAVRSYLADFLSDPRICPMNPVAWNIILKACILPHRSKASARKYQQIWTEEGSPLDVHMRSLANKVQNALDHQEPTSIVRYAMNYGAPSLESVLAELRASECDTLTVIPLYPQSAYSTTKAVEDKMHDALDQLHWHPPMRFVESYSDMPEYQKVIADSVRDAGFDPARDSLLIAFHSIPMKDIAAGDEYANLVFESSSTIAKLLDARDGTWQIGFQCRFDKSRRWLKPTVGEALQQLKDVRGRLFAVAPNFSIDCLETLYDIEVVLRQTYRQHNPLLKDADLIYVPCLNDSDAHADLMLSIINNRQPLS